ncbi:hypothetical protein HOLleu_05379 [Holothuria leucospilota]|uniref:Tyr recombinase domain-containing protein n=1 Tax=Holothuria leucospilota TaxID=206669 RepID=A0A9Q1HI69_HOLLE|nr:hypothetical protein HOLleu_05379 [Holothuria leucospilota]
MGGEKASNVRPNVTNSNNRPPANDPSLTNKTENVHSRLDRLEKLLSQVIQAMAGQGDKAGAPNTYTMQVAEEFDDSPPVDLNEAMDYETIDFENEPEGDEAIPNIGLPAVAAKFDVPSDVGGTFTKFLFGDDLSKQVKELKDEQKATAGFMKAHGSSQRQRLQSRLYEGYRPSSRGTYANSYYRDAGWILRSSAGNSGNSFLPSTRPLFLGQDQGARTSIAKNRENSISGKEQANKTTPTSAPISEEAVGPDQNKSENLSPTLLIRGYLPDRRLCAVNYLRNYVEETSTIRGAERYLLISYKKPFNRVTAQTGSRWLKEVMNAAGINTDVYKAHSTRAAATSSASTRAVSIQDIMAQAGWSNERTFRTYYKKPVTPTKDFTAIIKE